MLQRLAAFLPSLTHIFHEVLVASLTGQILTEILGQPTELSTFICLHKLSSLSTKIHCRLDNRAVTRPSALQLSIQWRLDQRSCFILDPMGFTHSTRSLVCQISHGQTVKYDRHQGFHFREILRFLSYSLTSNLFGERRGFSSSLTTVEA